MSHREAVILSDLAQAREAFRFWASQEGRLTRDEYAEKMAADRRVAELESELRRVRS
jgi:hypothetical protein